MNDPVNDASTDLVRSALRMVSSGGDLSAEVAEAFMAAVLDGSVTPAQLGGVLVGMRVRGETTEELTGFVRALRSRSISVAAPQGTIDTCGTGGDGRNTFNISTAASLVTGASGVTVAKTGNRAVSGISGSSDAMRALGLTVELDRDQAESSLAEDGYAYLHAPAFHPGMRHAGPVRMELGIRTAFNFIGPIANAAQPTRQLMGVPDEDVARRAAETLHALGTERAFVVTGDRIDELPLDDSGVIFDVTPDGVERRTVTSADHGLPTAPTESLAGGDGNANAALIESILRGEQMGPQRDVVVLNAGASLVVAGVATDIREGVGLADRAITSGAALDLLQRLRARTARISERSQV
ncbi:MAG: anthranilate phosphoribosyltransferase [Chloroflexota bacterium]